jgi:N-acetylneuraminate lyase
MPFRMTGLVAATFTPMHADGTLNLAQVEPIVEHLIGSGVAGLYVCGTTGEGPSLSTEERESVVTAYVAAAQGRIPVVVQVGHTCLLEAARLASHAQQVRGKSHFGGLAVVLQTRLGPGACRLPGKHHVRCPGSALLLLSSADGNRRRLGHARTAAPGARTFTDAGRNQVHGIERRRVSACVEYADGRFDILFGRDEMLLSGLAAGAQGAVGSTYNYLAPLYRRVIGAFQCGDMDQARCLQSLAVRLVHSIVRRRSLAGLKATMQIAGYDCGPSRLPVAALQPEEVEQLREELDALGFFQATRIRSS